MEGVITSYTFNDMRNKGKGYALLNVLNTLYPETFGEFYTTFDVFMKLLNFSSPYRENLEHGGNDIGLSMMEVENKIVFVCIISKNVIKRIFTLPQYRRKGYAYQFLKYTLECSNEIKKQLTAPVELRIVPLFKKAGWILTNEVNKDNTINMISYQ